MKSHSPSIFSVLIHGSIWKISNHRFANRENNHFFHEGFAPESHTLNGVYQNIVIEPVGAMSDSRARACTPYHATMRGQASGKSQHVLSHDTQRYIETVINTAMQIAWCDPALVWTGATPWRWLVMLLVAIMFMLPCAVIALAFYMTIVLIPLGQCFWVACHEMAEYMRIYAFCGKRAVSSRIINTVYERVVDEITMRVRHELGPEAYVVAPYIDLDFPITRGNFVSFCWHVVMPTNQMKPENPINPYISFTAPAPLFNQPVPAPNPYYMTEAAAPQQYLPGATQV